MMSDRHFQGNGIRLRAPEPEDLEVMFRFENATDVWEMSNTTGPYSRFQLKQYIEPVSYTHLTLPTILLV